MDVSRGACPVGIGLLGAALGVQPGRLGDQVGQNAHGVQVGERREALEAEEKVQEAPEQEAAPA